MSIPTALILERISDHFRVGDGCWLWTSTIAPTGYGVIKIKRQQFRAHRLVYELLIGPIPDGLDIDHLCRVRHCVNPAHLEPVTPSENNRRTAGHRPRRERCGRGHLMVLENLRTHTDKNGTFHRRCKACQQLNQMKRRIPS